MFTFISKAIALSALALHEVQAAVEADKIKFDDDDVSWGNTFSGFLPVSPTKALHYMFT